MGHRLIAITMMMLLGCDGADDSTATASSQDVTTGGTVTAQEQAASTGGSRIGDELEAGTLTQRTENPMAGALANTAADQERSSGGQVTPAGGLPIPGGETGAGGAGSAGIETDASGGVSIDDVRGGVAGGDTTDTGGSPRLGELLSSTGGEHAAQAAATGGDSAGDQASMNDDSGFVAAGFIAHGLAGADTPPMGGAGGEFVGPDASAAGTQPSQDAQPGGHEGDFGFYAACVAQCEFELSCEDEGNAGELDQCDESCAAALAWHADCLNAAESYFSCQRSSGTRCDDWMALEALDEPVSDLACSQNAFAFEAACAAYLEADDAFELPLGGRQVQQSTGGTTHGADDVGAAAGIDDEINDGDDDDATWSGRDETQWQEVQYCFDLESANQEVQTFMVFSDCVIGEDDEADICANEGTVIEGRCETVNLDGADAFLCLAQDLFQKCDEIEEAEDDDDVNNAGHTQETNADHGDSPGTGHSSDQDVTGGQFTRTLLHDGLTREFIIYVPAGYESSIALPLFFVFHGNEGLADEFLSEINMRSVADENTFIVVSPQGEVLEEEGTTHWNPSPPGPGNKSPVDDLGFVSALIDHIGAQYPIDDQRIYASGFSNGAFMAYGLGCTMSHRFAAIGAVSGTMLGGTEGCSPSHPMPVVSFRGTADDVCVYNGTDGYPSSDDVVSFWTNFNEITGEPVVTSVNDRGRTIERSVYSGGRNGSAMVRYKVYDGLHVWFDLNFEGQSTGQLIWDFVSQYRLSDLQ